MNRTSRAVHRDALRLSWSDDLSDAPDSTVTLAERFTLSGDGFPDEGWLALDSSDVRALARRQAESFAAELCVERCRNGRLDSFFDGSGAIYAVQRRCVGFTLIP